MIAEKKWINCKMQCWYTAKIKDEKKDEMKKVRLQY